MSAHLNRLGPLTLDVPAVLIGVQILAKGIGKLEGFHHHPVIVTSLLLLGGFVVAASFLPLWLERRVPQAHALFHVAEGVAMGLSAVVLWEKQLRIPVILAFVGCMYVLVGYLESRPLAQRKQMAGPLLKGMAVLFLIGGLVLAGFTALRDRDRWAFGAAGLCVLVGAALLAGAPRLLRPEDPVDA